jgi:hypothetical protein
MRRFPRILRRALANSSMRASPLSGGGLASPALADAFKTANPRSSSSSSSISLMRPCMSPSGPKQHYRVIDGILKVWPILTSLFIPPLFKAGNRPARNPGPCAGNCLTSRFARITSKTTGASATTSAISEQMSISAEI